MSNNYFRFKQFIIKQEGAAMKVGTDGVLIGAWSDVSDAKNALDIGTGSGVIALMIAQRCNAVIDAVEVDAESAMQANSNFNKSPWSSRIKLYHESFQEFYQRSKVKYDLMVSNPPYFSKSLKSSSSKRNVTRHTDELPYRQLIEGVTELLNPSGRFCAIFPYSEGNVFIAQAANAGLYCNKKVNVYSTTDKPVLRLLLEFSRLKGKLTEDELYIHNQDKSYTEAYKNLTGDFYLAF